MGEVQDRTLDWTGLRSGRIPAAAGDNQRAMVIIRSQPGWYETSSAVIIANPADFISPLSR